MFQRITYHICSPMSVLKNVITYHVNFSISIMSSILHTTMHMIQMRTCALVLQYMCSRLILNQPINLVHA